MKTVGCFHALTCASRRIWSHRRYESANIPHWEREGLGWPESCSLVSPIIGSASQPPLEAARQQELGIKGLGQSEGTPEGGITAEALVVTGWRDLWERRAEASGKIVVFAVDWEGYTLTSHYRGRGASIAAKFGAVATLIRSAASFSIGSPHTGSGGYMHLDTHLITAESSFGKECPFFVGLELPRDLPRIPHAGLSTEDSDMLRRMAARGEHIEIRLVMGGKMFEYDARGRNTIAEIRGTEYGSSKSLYNTSLWLLCAAFLAMPGVSQRNPLHVAVWGFTSVLDCLAQVSKRNRSNFGTH